MSKLELKQTVDDIWPMNGKRVLIRVDYNVPIRKGIISNDFRLRASLTTIRKVTAHGGIAILMSHLGRPKGINYADVQNDAERKQRELATWVLESGTGKTAFFTMLNDDDKRKILQWSTAAVRARSLTPGARNASPHSGRTQLFSILPEEEKRALLERFLTERRQQLQGGRNAVFPQLRQYDGFDEELSLKPVAQRLKELLGTPVHFARDCLDADDIVRRLRPGDVLLLENVRFYSNESSKDAAARRLMAEKLASYGDYFVSDAFGTAHRKSATVSDLPAVMGHGAAGDNMAKEISCFSRALSRPKRPMVAVVGGAKVSDKIPLLENMLLRIDTLIVGGAMSYTFLKAQGARIGKSFCEKGQSYTDKYGSKKTRDIVALATGLLEKAHKLGVPVLLPVDHVCHTEVAPTATPLVTEDVNVPDGYMALDIGPKTLNLFRAAIKHASTCVWNGPMGVFEIDAFSNGTFGVAAAMAECTKAGTMFSIIGGGDSAAAAEKCGAAAYISHVSTGGGASLEVLEGKELPGIAALSDRRRDTSKL